MATENDRQHDQSAPTTRDYLRFGAMIVTAMAVMYVLTYVNTFEAAHIRWSEQRLYMTLLMGAAMAVVMLLFMLGMYSDWRINTAILVASALIFTTGAVLVRSQDTIEDGSYMSSMIPHHSIAILTSERSEIRDVRVCRLAVAIIEAQRREIREMEWLLADIGANGPAETADEAAARPVPDFSGASLRECPG
ncbi:MAG TPA: DUF305 domain-containing protein [Acidimicrobiia bacterium]|nr:DUF305 domain-containing protein [Acidimicrobiia bacterium]